jgi:hypothetical protein
MQAMPCLHRAEELLAAVPILPYVCSIRSSGFSLSWQDVCKGSVHSCNLDALNGDNKHVWKPPPHAHTSTTCLHATHRGKFRSKPWDAVVDEAKRLVASGVRELNLIAEDTNQYGMVRVCPCVCVLAAHLCVSAWHLCFNGSNPDYGSLA